MGNSHTDGHGQARTGTDRKRGRWFYLEPCGEVRMQRSEVRGNRTANSLLTQGARTKRKRRKRFFGGGGRKRGRRGEAQP